MNAEEVTGLARAVGRLANALAIVEAERDALRTQVVELEKQLAPQDDEPHHG